MAASGECELAAERRTRDGLARLRANLDEELAAVRAGDAVSARRAAAAFHETVTEMADNEVLNELATIWRSRMRRLLGRHDHHLGMAEDHELLYGAIAERDATKIHRHRELTR